MCLLLNQIMQNLQYLGDSHTFVALEKGEKKKVVNGEIITVDNKMVSRLLMAGFQVVTTKTKIKEDKTAEVSIKVKK